MRIELEHLPYDERHDCPGPCWLCKRSFVTGAVAPWAYSSWPVSSDGGRLDCGPVCPMCLEEGPEAMYGRLKGDLRQTLAHETDDEVIQDAALLVSEGVPRVPTLEDLRRMERRCSPRPNLHIVDNR